MIFFKIILILFPGLLFASNFLPNYFEANIRQVYKSKITKKEKISKGNIYYRYPKKLRFEMKEPDPFTFVSNSKTSWYYRPPFIEGEKGQVSIKESPKFELLSILDLLHKGLISNEFLKIEKKEKNIVLINFTEKFKGQIEIKNISLVPLKDISPIKTIHDVSHFVLHKKNGNDVNLFFENISSNKIKINEKELFYFQIPSNTITD